MIECYQNQKDSTTHQVVEGTSIVVASSSGSASLQGTSRSLTYKNTGYQIYDDVNLMILMGRVFIYYVD